jgi:hypothetical protein
MTVASTKAGLKEIGVEFLGFLDNWLEQLPTVSLTEVTKDGADKVAVFSVDLINGFCYGGALASPRVAAVVEPSREIFEKAKAQGINQFVLIQDCHTPEAGEFSEFPQHCLAGTWEAEPVPALAELPFAGSFTTLPKNSLSGAINTGLEDWLKERPALETFIIVGDCTDLCVYQLAMYLKLRANSSGEHQRIIVPANAVDTYDLKLEGMGNHPGDFFHATFLYHMALNGVEVVQGLS